jgi:hypothetical protein
MLTTWDQRMRRDKVVIKRVQFPVPATADDLYTRLEQAITPKTKVLHFCHITNLSGQLFPVQRLCRMARARGIRTIVDGAHAGAQFPYKLRDLECDSYGVSLHKWLLAPNGTGLLFVRRDMIEKFWPLQAAPATSTTDIRKFEEIGTALPSGRHRRCARVPSGDRRRAQGRAVVLPDDEMGECAAVAAAHPHALEPEAGRDLGPRGGGHRRHGTREDDDVSLGQMPNRGRRPVRRQAPCSDVRLAGHS